MTPATIIKRAASDGVTLALTPAGTIKATGDQAAVSRWIPTIRQYKPDILAVLQEATNDEPRSVFDFAPPSDPSNDAEAQEERAAIIAEGCGMDQAAALQEAHWHVHRERCWRVFLRNAERILEAPIARREALLTDYQAQATRRYGEATARDMTEEMQNWIVARAVH